MLGKSPSWQDAGGACSGYLIQTGETNVLLDCGNGVFGKLREQIDYVELDAVLISHLHADHWLDLVPYSYALTYAPKQQPVPVHTWPGTDTPAPPAADRAARGDRDLPAGRRGLGQRGPDRERLRARGVRAGRRRSRSARSAPASTRSPTSSTPSRSTSRAEGADKLTYSADTRPGEEIVEIARDADLLLIEATLPRPERTGVRGHLTPEEAGEHAKRAGAKRVVITHISDELGDEWAREEAERGLRRPGRGRARGRRLRDLSR